MGGVGSGGYKNSPGDVETHSAWDLLDPNPNKPQKLRQARCKHCNKEMAQHTSRQRSHLLACQKYLDAMKAQGTENSITREAADPAAYPKVRKQTQTDSAEKRKATQKLADFSVAVRIQALALAEASISYDRIREITGMEGKVLDKMRKAARERGYDASKSMQMKEEFVNDSAKNGPGSGKPKKQKLDGVVQNGPEQATSTNSIPGYVRADTSNLPPGNWNFMTPTPVRSGASVG